MKTSLSHNCLIVLKTHNALEKAQHARKIFSAWRDKTIDTIGCTFDVPLRPSRPDKPELIDPRNMPKRTASGTDRGKAALLHAISHIELNAIDLACDIICRFSFMAEVNKPDGFSLPEEFFDDWIKVADDEAKHFLLLSERMADFGMNYGDLPAHDGLWESAERTANDFAARLAIVPMVLEARGLDVTPHMIEMMKGTGDTKTADTLRIIYEDEITHVKAGTHWFEAWCRYNNKNTETFWQTLVSQYFPGTLKRPFNHPAREDAGMIRDWYEPLADELFLAKLRSE